MAREMRGWSQRELAKQSGLTAAAISQFECCKREPNLESLIKLCQTLHITPNWLLGWKVK